MCTSARFDEPRVRPAGGVVFTCNGRGHDYHNELNAEGLGLQREVPGVPFIGMFAGGEYGPTFAYNQYGFFSEAEQFAGTNDRPHPLPRMGPLSFSCAVALFG